MSRCWSGRVLALAATVLLSTASGAYISAAHAQGAGTAPRPDLFATRLPVESLDLTPEQANRLATYRADPAAAEITVVRLAENALKQADRVNLNLGAGRNIALDKLRLNERSPQNYSWAGQNAPAAVNGASPRDTTEVNIVVNGDAAVGTIRAGGELYRLRPLSEGLAALIRVDQTRMPPEHPEGFEEMQAAPRGAVQQDAAPGTAQDSSASFSVIVAYTADAKAQAGDIDALIQLAIDETNQGYANSGVGTRVTLAHKYQTSYREAGDVGSDLGRFRGKGDGAADEVHDLRDQHAADVAVLLTGSAGGTCGVGYLDARADYAFAVVAQNCATGYYSFGHEIGHIQGARHNPETDPSSSPYTYGHGFYYPAQHWRTVMAYDCPGGCTRLNYWSNPLKNRDGVAMGSSALSNNARVLNETASRVANFRTGGDTGSGGGGGGGGTGGGGGGSTATWHAWEKLVSGVTSTPECSADGSGQIDCWVVRSGSRLAWSRWNGTAWQSWVDLGGATSFPPSCVRTRGRLSCFIVGTNGQLQQSVFNGSRWSGWINRGGSLRHQPSCTTLGATGGITCFANGTNGQLWQMTTYDGWSWRAPKSLGGSSNTRPACYPRGTDIDCYIQDTGYRVQVNRYRGGAWSGFTGLGGSVKSTPSCAYDGSRAQCFAHGRDGSLQTVTFDGARWGAWASLGGKLAGEPLCFPFGGTGELTCLAASTSGRLLEKRFDGKSWGAFNDRGGAITGRVAHAVTSDDRLDVFAKGTDGSLRHIAHY
jgi:hypothetical protein